MQAAPYEHRLGGDAGMRGRSRSIGGRRVTLAPHEVARDASDVAVPAVSVRNTSSRLGRRIATGALAGAELVELVQRRAAARAPVPSVGQPRAGARRLAAQLDGLAARLGLQLVGGALGGDAAAVDHRDAVGQPVGLLEVLRREQHRGAGIGERRMTDPDLAAAAGVEAGGRLVEEDHRRRRRPGSSPGRAGGACRPSRSDTPVAARDSSNRSSSSAARASSHRAAASPESRPSITRFSAPVSTSSTAADCPVSAMRCLHLARRGDDVEPRDPRTARVGRTSVVRMLIVVVLPAPLGPSRREHRARGDGEVEAVEHVGATERACAAPWLRWRDPWGVPSWFMSVYVANCL